MDKVREEFEVWAMSCDMCTYFNDVEYRHQSTEWAWRAWKSSRAALCVELPDVDYVKGVHYDFVGYDADLVKDALDNAGVPYK